MAKKIYITESQLMNLRENAVILNPNKVRVVVDFLDKTFLKGTIPTVSDDGYPSQSSIVAMKGVDGKPVRYMTDKQLFYLLQDKFQHIMSDKAARDKFLKHVMIEWYLGKVSKNGLTSRNYLSEGWKGAALGAIMGASMLSGMQSCSGPMNPAMEVVDNQGHPEYSDNSNYPWVFKEYIGNTFEAAYLVVEDKYRIRSLVMDVPNDYKYRISFQDCAWAIFYVKTEKRDNVNVDIFHSQNMGLIDEHDSECYFELWYTDEEDKPMNERVTEVRVYRNEESKRETMWRVMLDKIKGTTNLNIKNK